MLASIDSNIQIEDLRNHPAETVLTLRSLLAGGATLIPDAKRRGFYEVESGSLVYYIHDSCFAGQRKHPVAGHLAERSSAFRRRQACVIQHPAGSV